jgi:hypothetical protein
MAAAATPRGRPVPLGTRKLGFSPQDSASGDRKNCSAQRALTARLGKYFRFNSSLKRCISLLRRGARDFSLHFATQTQQKPLWGRPR